MYYLLLGRVSSASGACVSDSAEIRKESNFELEFKTSLIKNQFRIHFERFWTTPEKWLVVGVGLNPNQWLLSRWLELF